MSKHDIQKNKFAISRRKFLHESGVVLGGTLLAGSAFANDGGCQLTERDGIGPFYRFGAPFQTRLAGADEPGDRLVLTGTVFSSDCITPLPGAFVEVWQANEVGVYDTDQPGNFTEVTDFNLRGNMYTNEQGQYEIETIVPGHGPITDKAGVRAVRQYLDQANNMMMIMSSISRSFWGPLESQSDEASEQRSGDSGSG